MVCLFCFRAEYFDQKVTIDGREVELNAARYFKATMPLVILPYVYKATMPSRCSRFLQIKIGKRRQFRLEFLSDGFALSVFLYSEPFLSNFSLRFQNVHKLHFECRSFLA